MKIPRVYPILDTQLLAARGCDLETAATAWLTGGAGILQFRHKGPWTQAVFDAAQHIAVDCYTHNALFVINDRADVAKLLEAGLHVGQDDLPPADARLLLGPDAVIGFSTHNPAQMACADAEPLSYVAFGPVFATASKQNPDPVVGLEGLAECGSANRKPVVAIGGITRQNARAVWATGAASVAVISDMIPEPCTRADLRRRMEEWQQLAQT
jgi:thiamine-phosphate pyrophosphorylase